MLQWAIAFLVLALIAGVLGFGGVMTISIEFAKILFVVFLVMFAITAIAGALRRKKI